MLVAQLHILKQQILENDRRIMASARETELGRRLMEMRHDNRGAIDACEQAASKAKRPVQCTITPGR